MKINAKIIHYSIGPLGSALISLITLPLIAWFYTVSDVAKFAIYQAVLLLYTLIFSFGLDQAFIREYYDSKNKNKLLKNICLGVFLPSVLFIFLSIILFKEDFSYLLFEEYSFSLIFFTLLSCILSLGIRILSSIQRVNNQAILFSLSQIIPKFIFLVLIVIFTFFLPKSFENIVWAQFLGLLCVFIYFLSINKVYLINAFNDNFDRNLLKSYYSYGFPLVFTGIFIWGLKISDRFYLKFLSNLEELGLYSMAISIAGAVGIFSSIFNTIWAPLVYRWVEGGELYSSEIKAKVENIALKAALAILIISILSILCSRLVPFFLPNAYAKIYLILPLCILSLLLYTLSEITGIGINLMKKTKYNLFSCFFAIIVHVIISILLIPNLGAAGAAIASGISFYIFFIIRNFFSGKIWMRLNLAIINLIAIFALLIASAPILLW